MLEIHPKYNTHKSHIAFMKIVYKEKRGENYLEGASNIFLADQSGGYFCAATPQTTQYAGWFTYEKDTNDLYKTINNIYAHPAPDSIIFSSTEAKRITGATEENFKLSEKQLEYTITNPPYTVTMELDFRNINDYDDRGRIYSIETKNDYTIIKYTKYTDNFLFEIKEQRYIIIKGSVKIQEGTDWIKKEFSFDASRNTKSEFYVFRLKLNFPSNKKTTIKLGYGRTEEEAILNSNKKNKGIKKLSGMRKNKTANQALNALNNLILYKEKKPVIFAGFPWFYQAWSRDELISLGGLIYSNNKKIAKQIIMRHLEEISPEGIVRNRFPSSELGSADATGWLYKRIDDLLKLDSFSKKEIQKIQEILKKSIDTINSHKMRNGLVYNEPKETWMDTTTPEGKDQRAGYRIEIQALTLKMFELAKKINKIGTEKYTKYKKMEEGLKQTVLRTMLINGNLIDGLDETATPDFTKRPNIFLAYYIYPELLSKKDWEKTFDNVFNECWLDWGGLSSISKNNDLFQEKHTGPDNKSYHRGDSWLFINNISTICLHEVNKEKYSDKIKKILEASAEEMLLKGFLGQCSELSNANSLESTGCLAQAWSASTLAEALIKTETK